MATLRGWRYGFEIPLGRGYIPDAVVLCGFQGRFAERYAPECPEHICIFEAKASRADFLGTFGPGPKHANRHESIGTLHWCVTPRGLVAPEEVPAFWGLLEISGNGLRETKQPVYCTQKDARVHEAAYALLWYGQIRRGVLRKHEKGTLFTEDPGETP